MKQILLVAIYSLSFTAHGAALHVGAATASITPDGPVALSGQMHTRIAEDVESEVIAAALALETRDGDTPLEQAILVACDLVAIRDGVLEKVQARLAERLPDFDNAKLILSATHTHTGPVTTLDRYNVPVDGVMQPADYVEFLCDRIADAAAEAWETRAAGQVGWGLGHAVVAQNRRSVYANGESVMYGKTDREDFRMIEGAEDHGVEVLFFWDANDALIATALNVACPSQEVESRSAVNADFWHEVRESLKARHGENLVVLGWTGASGDQSPHLMYREKAEERMRELRGLTRLEELARRIAAAWEEAYAGARQEKHSDVTFEHEIKTIELPLRVVTDEEYAAAKEKVAEYSGEAKNVWRVKWHGSVVSRYEAQQAGTSEPYEMTLHALRLGDIAIATNDFELFTDFGIPMKSRSKALQTFIIQLAGQGSYLPSERAVRGGGYSAIVESSVVGPEGGQVLVDETVATLNGLWEEAEEDAN